ncbi:MAG: hypothetical protein JWN91_3654 [Nocardioides sp.]|nr:hypothetical protein [Nocardioides sp.]
MASVTPIASGSIGGYADDEIDTLHLVTDTTAEADALRRWLHRLPRRLAWRPLWLPAVDVVLATAVLALPVGLTGPQDLAPSAAALLGLGWFLALVATGGWSARSVRDDRLGVLLASIVRAVALTGLGCWVADALLEPSATSDQLLAATTALALLTLLARLVAAALIGRRVPTRVSIAGGVADVQRLLDELHRTPAARFEAAAVCLDRVDLDQVGAIETDDLPVCLGVDRVVESAVAVGAAAILLAPGPALSPDASRRIAWLADEAGLEVYVGTGLLDVNPARAAVTRIGDLAVLQIRTGTPAAPARLVKAVAERLLAALAILTLLPLLATIGLAITLDSPGGTIFSQRRVGRGGELFTMHKFRTMGVDAEQRVDELADRNDATGVLFKMRADPRITRVGAFLRRYSLDELPQLFDVVAGHMSLVGPRPALPEEVARYDVDPQHRLVVKPGLTGLWQVSGRSDLSWPEAVRLDLHYVDNWSLGLDLRILVRTVGAVLAHRGAY